MMMVLVPDGLELKLEITVQSLITRIKCRLSDAQLHSIDTQSPTWTVKITTSHVDYGTKKRSP